MLVMSVNWACPVTGILSLDLISLAKRLKTGIKPLKINLVTDIGEAKFDFLESMGNKVSDF